MGKNGFFAARERYSSDDLLLYAVVFMKLIRTECLIGKESLSCWVTRDMGKCLCLLELGSGFRKWVQSVGRVLRSLAWDHFSPVTHGIIHEPGEVCRNVIYT